MLIVANIPQILVFFAIMGYFLLRIHWSVSPARKEATRLARQTHAPITNLAKITFTGTSVIRAFGYSDKFAR